MENGELERRLDLIENSFIRFEGKVDLINHQLESGAAAAVERAGNLSAAISLNQSAIVKHEREIHLDVSNRLRTLEDWRTTLKAYGKGTLAVASFISATLSSVTTWAIIDALTKRHT